jgi:hypothetical protein
MRPQILVITAFALLFCSCAHRKEILATPSAAGLSKSATPAERLKHFFPPGVNWNNASPTQISEAVYNAAKSDPDNVVDVSTAALDEIKKTGRFPATDSKQAVDPEPKRTLFDVLFPKKKSAQ